MTKAELEEINERLNLEIIRLRKEGAEKDAQIEQLSEHLEELGKLFEDLSERQKEVEKFQTEVSDFIAAKEKEIEDDDW